MIIYFYVKGSKYIIHNIYQYISHDFQNFLSNEIHDVYNDNEISNLKKQLNEANEIIEQQILTISDLENKLNNYNSTIDNYKNIIKQKDLELNNLKLQLKNQINKNNASDNNNNININEMMCVNFISSDQKIHFAVACIKNNIFAEIEEKLYKQYPEYRETNNTFLANGTIVLRFKTIAENKIGNGLPITLIVPH